MRKLLASFLMLVCCLAQAAVAFDAASTNNAAAVTSLSWTHTPVGTPTGVGVQVAWETNVSATITAITYGGQTMTQVGSTQTLTIGSGFFTNNALYGLANPPSGAQTVSITFSGTSYAVGGAITVTGSDLTTCFSAFAQATGTASTIATVTVTSNSNELVMDAVDGSAATTWTAQGSQTQRWSVQRNDHTAASSTLLGSASMTMSEVSGGSLDWAITAASFKVASAAPLGFGKISENQQQNEKLRLLVALNERAKRRSLPGAFWRK